MARPLNVFKQTTVDGDGNARVTVGPQRPRQHWSVRGLSVRCGGDQEPIAEIYRNAVVATSFIDGTFIGSNDYAEFSDVITLSMGDYLTIAWAGAEPGALASVRVSGTMDA